jgi:hypothetical protein
LVIGGVLKFCLVHDIQGHQTHHHQRSNHSTYPTQTEKHYGTFWFNVFQNFECQATDLRDKVFGLLGITAFSPDLPPDQPAFAPDYSMFLAEVYARAKFAMLRERDDPHFWFPLPLMHTAGSSQASRVLNFPSRACDFSVSLGTESKMYRINLGCFIPERENDSFRFINFKSHRSVVPHAWLSDSVRGTIPPIIWIALVSTYLGLYIPLYSNYIQ